MTRIVRAVKHVVDADRIAIVEAAEITMVCRVCGGCIAPREGKHWTPRMYLPGDRATCPHCGAEGRMGTPGDEAATIYARPDIVRLSCPCGAAIEWYAHPDGDGERDWEAEALPARIACARCGASLQVPRMALAPRRIIRRACGCLEDHWSEEVSAEYLRATDCKACSARRRYLRWGLDETGWADIIGTPRQERWAQDIRRQAVDRILAGLPSWIAPATPGISVAMEALQDAMAQMERPAAWWIEHRVGDQEMHDAIHGAYAHQLRARGSEGGRITPPAQPGEEDPS